MISIPLLIVISSISLCHHYYKMRSRMTPRVIDAMVTIKYLVVGFATDLARDTIAFGEEVTLIN
jgi:hypothetical protein